MAAVSVFRDTNEGVMTSREDTLIPYNVTQGNSFYFISSMCTFAHSL